MFFFLSFFAVRMEIFYFFFRFSFLNIDLAHYSTRFNGTFTKLFLPIYHNLNADNENNESGALLDKKKNPAEHLNADLCVPHVQKCYSSSYFCTSKKRKKNTD